MDLKEIMSVSGHSGLFRFISQGRNGIIVESFADQKRSFVSASQKVSSLADIAIFTDGEEIPLHDVFKSIYDLGAEAQVPDAKSSPEDLKKFLEKVLPNYDRDRVYVSDIKKLVAWYHSLKDLNLLNFDEKAAEPAEAETNTTSEEAEPAKTKAKPKGEGKKDTKPVNKAASKSSADKPKKEAPGKKPAASKKKD
ncbi:MAG: DUF5606 domain-containing protein [Prolixibacteraceae bacterium]|nr:DUF5606 domain-containing protein [Prolixibacteraceae bacterium]